MVESSHMQQFDVVENWIASVAVRRGTRNRETEAEYRRALARFCNFTEKTPQQIVEEYEATEEKICRRKYARYLKVWAATLMQQGYAIGSISTMMFAVRSFFKYSDLPLAYVPVARNKVTFHNRDMTKQEVVQVLQVSKPRDRAFFSMMAQSGLRPLTLCALKIKHIEPDFSQGVIPCKIEVPEELAKGQYGSYFTFMGEESVKYLKAYLTTRPDTDTDSYIFTAYGTENPLDRTGLSQIFRRTVDNLKEKGLMAFERKGKGKPSEVRLYNLRKFFRKYAGQAGIEYVNFWMGHKTNYKAPNIPASDVHYFSREDVEFQRQLYKEKAMPFLRLETATPSETDKVISKQAEEVERLKDRIYELERKNLELKQRLNGFTLSSDQVQELLRRIEKLEQAQKQK